MALLERAAWYDIARTTNWTPTYVAESDLFPEVMAGAQGVPMEVWETYDEPYKTSYPEYVRIQRDKDAGAYSVKAALERSRMFENADPGWLSILKAHYGAIALGEYAAMSAEARMARFGRAPGMRNMATFGMLDENRHGQLQLYFPHDYCQRIVSLTGRTRPITPTNGPRSLPAVPSTTYSCRAARSRSP
ncbi:protein of unknown function (plasmid) [Cupriavidus taiwanensis]|nr:protein of unknown function [Cupriavidus taiwanensis]